MAKQPVNYLSYLLRLWRTGEHSAWKASLEDPQTGVRWGFGSLEVLFRFLKRKAQSLAEPDDNEFSKPKGAQSMPNVKGGS